MQKNRKFLVPTLWISAIAFIGSGAVGWGSYKYGSSADSVAKVGDIEITSAQLQNRVNSIFNYYNNLFGGKLTKEQAKRMNIEQQALASLTNETLLLNYAKEYGIVALDDEIIKEYTSIDAFKVDGKFSKSKFEQILRAQGISKKEFEKEIKNSVILNKLKKLLSMPVTPLEIESLFAAKQLSDHIIIKKVTKDITKISIPEESIKKYWLDHKNDYMSQKEYKLAIIKTLPDDINATDDELKNYYNQNRFKFKDKDGKIKKFEDAKESVKKALSFKKAKSKALKSYLALKKGKLKADKEIVVTQSDAPFDFTLLKDAKVNSFIKAVKVDDGYITAKVISINPPKPLDYEKAKSFVEAKLKQEELYKLLEQEGKTLTTKPIEDGKDLGYVAVSDNKKISDLPPTAAAEFLRTVFSKPKKVGYYIYKDSVIAYEIKDQKLFDKESLKKERDILVKNTKGLKRDMVDKGLINSLKKRYEIRQLVKFKKEG